MNLTPNSLSLPRLLPLNSSHSWVSRFSFLHTLTKTDWVSIVFTILGLVSVVGGGLSLLVSNSGFMNQTEVQAASQTRMSGLGQVLVSVTGAVSQPGLYTLQTGDRVGQALQAAGGILPTADQAALSGVNLAEKVTDGQQIHIVEEQSQVSGKSTNDQTQVVGTISLNTASQKELETLPGIGAARAGEIIEGRPYQSLNDLETKEILTASMFDKIKNLISL